MFALLLVALTLAVLTRLAVVIRNDRPTDPPRSHSHEQGSRWPRTRVV